MNDVEYAYLIEKTQNPSRRPLSPEQAALRETLQLRLQEAKRDG